MEWVTSNFTVMKAAESWTRYGSNRKVTAAIENATPVT
jgi:hypothetical protein